MKKLAKIHKEIPKENNPLLWNLENLSKKADLLILWLDCDREGESIAYEVIDICMKANPKIEIKRAIFSVVEAGEIKNAIENLQKPNKNLALAVDLRQELDLRIGSSYTVFQTVNLQGKHNDLKYSMMSYGPCQTPTLGFIVQRYKERTNFRSENFWFLEGTFQKDQAGKPIILNWRKENNKSKNDLQSLFKSLPQPYHGKITNITESDILKYKPYPLNTIKLQKLASDHLNYPSDKTMKTAELLYNKGYISYPRTETNAFKPFTNFKKLVEFQAEHEVLSQYATSLLSNKIFNPREGPKNDNSHPPIYPAKALSRKNINLDNTNLITPEEIALYELIARSFLASCSKDASAVEKIFEVDLQGEPFYFKELKIKELNYLQIYPYEKWLETQAIIDKFEIGQILENVKIYIKEGKTYPPKLLNESELIDLMDKFEIGTDSTIHEHIKKIQEREFAIKIQNEFHPTALGYALIETYEQMGLDLAKPNLRSMMEKEIKLVADGIEEKEKVLKKNLAAFEEIYKKLADQKSNFGDVFVRIFNEKLGTLKAKEKKKTFYKKK